MYSENQLLNKKALKKLFRYILFYYGAYGSNLNKEQMKKRCPLSNPIISFHIVGWKLVFKGVADIEKDKNSKVLLGLYSITADCEKALDYYEDFPELYTKTYFYKELLGKKIKVMVYVMNNMYKYSIPSRNYFLAIKKGYSDWNLDSSVLLSSARHSIKNNSNHGYKSKNWQDKKFIDIPFLNRFN